MDPDPEYFEDQNHFWWFLTPNRQHGPYSTRAEAETGYALLRYLEAQCQPALSR